MLRTPPPEIRNPAGGPGSRENETTIQAKSTPKAPKKKDRVLNWLLAGGSLNRFEAARHPEVADSALNSTIAELGGDGIVIDRKDEIVPGRYGRAHVKRYHLNPDPDNIARAIAFLGNDCWVTPLTAIEEQVA